MDKESKLEVFAHDLLEEAFSNSTTEQKIELLQTDLADHVFQSLRDRSKIIYPCRYCMFTE